MKNFSQLVFALVLVLSAFNGTSQVSSDYLEGTTFKEYKTYNLASYEEGVLTGMDPINAQRIEKALHAEMREKGYVLSDDPDLLVSYFTVVKEKQDMYTFIRYYGRWRHIPVTEVTVYNYDEGTLVVDMIDTKTNQVMWHGTVSGTVVKNKKKLEKKIQKAVEAVLNQYEADVSKTDA
ncbi:MAG: DUF4136 domain-containing protein [Bacteroidota bacterium]